ncbi:MAG: hypothetical protein H6Q73_1235 [Firmicutes bacterium]|nr:hypothetical protein [Bacillota bacterium]
MNKPWLVILAVMLGGSIIKYGILQYLIFSPVIAVIIDLLVFSACYLTLRRYPYIDLKRSMQFIGVIIALEILFDLGIINELIREIVFFILIAWGISKQGGSGGPPRQRHKWHK